MLSFTNKYEAKPDLQEARSFFNDRNRKFDPDYFRKAQSMKISNEKQTNPRFQETTQYTKPWGLVAIVTTILYV